MADNENNRPRVELIFPPGVGPSDYEWNRVGGKPEPPDARYTLQEAKHEQETHQLRIEVAQEMDRWLSHKRFGYYKRDRDAIISGEVEPYYDNSLITEENAAISFIASMKVAFEPKFTAMHDADEASAKSDLLHYHYEAWEDEHYAAGNGSIRYDVPKSLSRTGMVAASMLIDPENLDTGIRTRLADPLSIFPVYESGLGLSRVYRIYSATAASVIGDFDTSERLVEQGVREVIGSKYGRDYDPNEMVEVTEYWDRGWMQLFVNDQLIFELGHNYGDVPWIITHGNFGRPAFMSATPTHVELEAEGLIYRPQSKSVREEELVRQYQPFLWDRLFAHSQTEKVGSQFMTLLRRAKDPPRVHKQTVTGSALHGDVEIDNQDGGLTRIKNDEDIANLEALPTADVVNPLLAFLDLNRQASGVPALMMGNMPGSQASGTAIDILSQSGARVWAPLVYATQSFYKQWGERVLRYIGNFGPLLNDGRGYITTPRRNPNPRTGETTPHIITADLIRRTGTRISVTLHQFNPASIAPMAAALGMAMEYGLTDRRDAIKLMNITDDIEGTIQRMRHDDMDKVPEVMLAEMLEAIHREIRQAIQNGDMEDAQRLMHRAHFISSQIDFNQMVRMPGAMNNLGDPTLAAEAAGIPPGMVAGGGGGGEGEQGGGGGTIPGTPVPSAPPVGEAGLPSIHGNSTPQYGIPTGTQGGRPRSRVPQG